MKFENGVRNNLRHLGLLLERLGPGAGAIVAFLLILLVGSLISPSFLTERNIFNVLRQTCVLGIVSVGMTFVILSGGIDLSVGMALSFFSVVAALLYDGGQGHPLPLVILMTLTLGAAVGAFNGAIIVWRCGTLHCYPGHHGNCEWRREWASRI